MNTPFPPSLINQLSELQELNIKTFLDFHNSGEQITSIRINPFKEIMPHSVWSNVPWLDQGFYLTERPLFTADPYFHAGCYYVQEASSMFIGHIIRQLTLDHHPLIALDLCAAPGGKSTLLNSILHPKSLLLANEPIKTRANVLSDNLSRWGNHNIVVSNNDPSAFTTMPGFFDLMLVDAPCSGSGMFRKDPQAIGEWSEAAVKLCSQRQQRILTDSLATLKEGGILIYSTCSYSTEENEDIADWIGDSGSFENVPISYPEAWGIVKTHSAKHKYEGYRFYPHRLKGEGLYISIFRKTASQRTYEIRRKKSGTKAPRLPLIHEWVHPDADLSLLEIGDNLLMIPKEHQEQIAAFQHNLYLKKAGTTLGKAIRSEFIPHHELALSIHSQPHLAHLDLELPDALNFLRKKDIQVATPQKGWVLVRYNGYGIGWAKVLANRINNYYPKEWRILHI